MTLGQRRVMAAIEACRTAALGGHVERCEDCGETRIAYNSCRNRHCPKRQGLARAQWDAEVQYLSPRGDSGWGRLLRANGGNRRASPVTPRPREGPLTEPTAGPQPCRREPLFMPLSRHFRVQRIG